jgi:catechol 2,3-dioxygenase-like lactoylglutathione lyase family enzyme
MKLFVNLFCQNISAQLDFYTALLGLPEAMHSRSPIYRAIEAPGFQFGFHAPPAYALLGLGDRTPAADQRPSVTAYATFMLDAPADVQAGSERVASLGGQLIKSPYATYYREWQAVLADPEGHVFRLSTLGLPPGVQAPTLPSFDTAAP